MRKVHLQALIFWTVYSFGMKALYVRGVFGGNKIIFYVLIVSASVLFGVLFLYLFNHEDFFKFAKVIEKKEMVKEKRWIRILKGMGKNTMVITIGLVSGSLLAALSVRLILRKAWYQYLLVALVSGVSTIFWLTFGRSLINFIWK